MKKAVVALLLAGAVLALSQCELFYTTVEYKLTGTSSPIDMMYQNEEGLVEEDSGTSSPWSASFELKPSDRPFLAFIQVTNNGIANAVTVEIREDGDLVQTGTAAAGGGSVAIYWVME